MSNHTEPFDEALEELRAMCPGFDWTPTPEPTAIPPGYFQVIDSICLKANAPLGTVVDYEGFAEILRRIPVDLTYKPRKTKRRTIKKRQPK